MKTLIWAFWLAQIRVFKERMFCRTLIYDKILPSTIFSVVYSSHVPENQILSNRFATSPDWSLSTRRRRIEKEMGPLPETCTYNYILKLTIPRWWRETWPIFNPKLAILYSGQTSFSWLKNPTLWERFLFIAAENRVLDISSIHSYNTTTVHKSSIDHWFLKSF